MVGTEKDNLTFADFHIENIKRRVKEKERKRLLQERSTFHLLLVAHHCGAYVICLTFPEIMINKIN